MLAENSEQQVSFECFITLNDRAARLFSNNKKWETTKMGNRMEEAEEKVLILYRKKTEFQEGQSKNEKYLLSADFNAYICICCTCEA